jgi:hypothetical protein
MRLKPHAGIGSLLKQANDTIPYEGIVWKKHRGIPAMLFGLARGWALPSFNALHFCGKPLLYSDLSFPCTTPISL